MSELNDAERIRRGQNAQRALVEFLDPAFEAVHEAYSQRLKEIATKTPWEAGKITALANATRIVEEVRNQIAALVHDGSHASSNMIRVEKIEKLSPAKRRLLNIGPF